MIKKKKKSCLESIKDWCKITIWKPYLREYCVPAKRCFRLKYRWGRDFYIRHKALITGIGIFAAFYGTAKFTEMSIQHDIAAKQENIHYESPYGLLALFVSSCAVGIALRGQPELLQAVKDATKEIQNLRKAITEQGNQNTKMQ